MSLLAQCPGEPVYYIVDWRIFELKDMKQPKGGYTFDIMLKTKPKVGYTLLRWFWEKFFQVGVDL